MHTLSSAARAVGVAKSTIWRAVKAGGLSAHELTNGTYAIYPGELLHARSRLPESPKPWRSAKQSASRFGT
jgi:hypothetical protein